MHFTPILATIVLQYQALAAPVLVPVQAATNGGGPGIRTGTVPTIQYVAHAAPVVVPSQVVSPVSSGQPVYPAQVFPRPRLHASRQLAFFFDKFTAPTVVAAPDLTPLSPHGPVRRPHSIARYVQAEPHFGVPVMVPVMSWTGWYDWHSPKWGKKRHASQAPFYFQDTVLFPDVVVAPDMAHAEYPDLITRTPKLRQYPQPSWPPFTADVSVAAPALSWQPEYPDRIWPKRGLPVRFHPFFVMHSEPVPVIAVTHLSGGRGYYLVPGHPRRFVVPPHRRKFTVN